MLSGSDNSSPERPSGVIVPELPSKVLTQSVRSVTGREKRIVAVTAAWPGALRVSRMLPEPECVGCARESFVHCAISKPADSCDSVKAGSSFTKT